MDRDTFARELGKLRHLAEHAAVFNAAALKRHIGERLACGRLDKLEAAGYLDLLGALPAFQKVARSVVGPTMASETAGGEQPQITPMHTD